MYNYIDYLYPLTPTGPMLNPPLSVDLLVTGAALKGGNYFLLPSDPIQEMLKLG